mmetsp:Transcript_4749/g.11798  ORF Transcript_4749/g.11798 Transcript_4749/m.11798 type:complete len:271 (-) Transcript_4749:746-1558(-)
MRLRLHFGNGRDIAVCLLLADELVDTPLGLVSQLPPPLQLRRLTLCVRARELLLERCQARCIFCPPPLELRRDAVKLCLGRSHGFPELLLLCCGWAREARSFWLLRLRGKTRNCLVLVLLLHTCNPITKHWWLLKWKCCDLESFCPQLLRSQCVLHLNNLAAKRLYRGWGAQPNMSFSLSLCEARSSLLNTAAEEGLVSLEPGTLYFSGGDHLLEPRFDLLSQYSGLSRTRVSSQLFSGHIMELGLQARQPLPQSSACLLLVSRRLVLCN